jgi:hypothetical protein
MCNREVVLTAGLVRDTTPLALRRYVALTGSKCNSSRLVIGIEKGFSRTFDE